MEHAFCTWKYSLSNCCTIRFTAIPTSLRIAAWHVVIEPGGNYLRAARTLRPIRGGSKVHRRWRNRCAKERFPYQEEYLTFLGAAADPPPPLCRPTVAVAEVSCRRLTVSPERLMSTNKPRRRTVVKYSRKQHVWATFRKRTGGDGLNAAVRRTPRLQWTAHGCDGRNTPSQWNGTGSRKECTTN